MGSTDSTSGSLPTALYGYDVVSQIGTGAGSALYAVTDSKGQLFALKHVIKKTDADDRFIAQLQNEFDMSRLFRHPGLRKVIDLKFPRKFFSNKVSEAGLVLEFVDGNPLDQNVPEDVPTLLGLFVHCAAALASMHQLRLVHCDFKPSNVLIGDGGKIKVIDFGQSCKTGFDKARVQGTPDFITPEQVKCVAVDGRTDIYSFGASLYWCLTKQKVPTYYNADRTKKDMIKKQTFPTPRDLRPEVSQELSDLVMHCIRYNPDYRPADMVTVLTTLEGLMRPSQPAAPVAAAPTAANDAAVPAHEKHKPRVVKDWGLGDLGAE